METEIALAERLYAALDDDDVTPFLDLCAPDAIVEYPAEERLPYGGTWLGRERIGEFLEAHDAAEEIVVFEPMQMAADGDTVFVLGQFVGKAKPMATTWSTRFVHVLTFRDGLLKRWEAFFDTAAAIAARSGADSAGA